MAFFQTKCSWYVKSIFLFFVQYGSHILAEGERHFFFVLLPLNGKSFILNFGTLSVRHQTRSSLTVSDSLSTSTSTLLLKKPKSFIAENWLGISIRAARAKAPSGSLRCWWESWKLTNWKKNIFRLITV